MKRISRGLIVLLLFFVVLACESAQRPNILFISVDDMNCDSVGAFGCELEGTTPNIDRLAKDGMRFQFAHVQVGNCMPSRNVMFSGRYPHNNRVEGFYPVKDKDYPVLCDLFKEAGYLTAIRGKASHSTPFHPYPWGLNLDVIDGEKMHMKDAVSYGRSAKVAFETASKEGKPFCLLVNISDPHKPFYAMSGKQEVVDDPHKPSRIYKPNEVPIPGFLFDDPEVRLELAHYYSSVRRADDCVGEVLKQLKASGVEDNTMIVFLSDHGMPLPFAKTALWHHSTWTPWIVKWPGVTKAGAIDRKHMISGVDLLPTLLDVAGIKHPQGMDGRSFASLLKGDKQNGREFVFKVYNENSGANRNPMRGIQSRKYLYLFNPWVDGKRVFKTATTGTIAYRRMKELAGKSPELAARLDLFEHGVIEEFYDVEKDPDCLNNLIADKGLRSELNRHRAAMEDIMREAKDHLLGVLQQRENVKVRDAYMKKVQEEATARRNARRNEGKSDAPKKRKGLIKLELGDSDPSDGKVSLKVHHKLNKRMGSQKLHATLKDAGGKRIERKVVEVSGTGIEEIVFQLEAVELKGIMYSCFIGADFGQHLQIEHTEITSF